MAEWCKRGLRITFALHFVIIRLAFNPLPPHGNIASTEARQHFNERTLAGGLLLRTDMQGLTYP